LCSEGREIQPSNGCRQGNRGLERTLAASIQSGATSPARPVIPPYVSLRAILNPPDRILDPFLYPIDERFSLIDHGRLYGGGEYGSR
jgi:hypothetical protein